MRFIIPPLNGETREGDYDPTVSYPALPQSRLSLENVMRRGCRKGSPRLMCLYRMGRARIVVACPTQVYIICLTFLMMPVTPPPFQMASFSPMGPIWTKVSCTVMPYLFLRSVLLS